MTTCEKCGKTFPLPEGPEEVTSTRILCPTCKAEREAEKKRQAAARAQGAPAAKPRPAGLAPAAPAAPAARPASAMPASRPPAPAARPAAPAARPAAPNAKPAAPAARPATPAAKPAAPAARPVAPAARPADPAARAAARPAARPAAAAPAERPARNSVAAPARTRAARLAEPEEDEEPPRRGRARHEPHDEPPDRTMMFGWIAALVVTVVAGVFFFKVKSQKDLERAQEAARIAEVQGILTKIKAFDVTKPDQATELIAYAEETRSTWERENSAVDIESLIARGKNTKEAEATRKETQERFDAILETLKDPASHTADELMDLRRRLDEIEGRSSLMPQDFTTKLTEMRKATDHACADKLLEEAKAASAGGPENQRAGLQKYTKAEDELLRLLEKAHNSQNKEEEAWFTQRYRQCITESDALCDELFTPEYQQKVARRDLLSSDEAASWVFTSGLEGFTHDISGGTMRITGPVKADGRSAVLSVGDREKWRDFALEFEFTLVKGTGAMYLRLGQAVNSTVESIDLAVEGPHALKLGEKYTCEIDCIGSKLSVSMEAGSDPTSKEINWTHNRKGAIGLVIPEGTELVVSRMRIRVLR